MKKNILATANDFGSFKKLTQAKAHNIILLLRARARVEH
jgi:hypothetical protein